MKVLILSTFLEKGGAGIAAKRLFSALNKETDLQVTYLAMFGKKGLADLKTLDQTILGRILAWVSFSFERLYFLLYEKSKAERYRFSPAKIGFPAIKAHSLISQADIVHIHWTQMGFLDLKSFRKIIESKKKVVITMHDMWLFTGGCHYSFECTNYLENCGNCIFLKNPHAKDLSWKLHLLKKRILKEDVSITACSSWLAREAERSSILREKKVHVIPNPINTEVFKPTVVKTKDSRLIKVLFGAFNIKDKRKGFHFLKEILENWQEEICIQLFVFGIQGDQNIDFDNDKVKVNSYGYISDENKMAELYRSADLYLLPSMYDNLPTTVMESLSCGTPCVAFEVGGVSDLIKHQKNGYLAKAFDLNDFKKGIIDCHNKLDVYSSNAREITLKSFSEESVSKKILKLYQTD